MSNQRKHSRTPLKCRIRISHPSFGDLFGLTRNLSDGGIYVQHSGLADLPLGTRVSAQVQDLPGEAPLLEMEVTRTDAEGAGLRFTSED